MDASQITKLLQKQNTRYINRSQTVDSSTLTWQNQIQSSKYIKGVKTCDGAQNTNVPTNPACPVGDGICSFGGSGRTTSLQSGSPQKFLNVLSGASGSASQVYSSESILLQQAGKQFCGVPVVSPARQNSYVELSCGTNIQCTQGPDVWSTISGYSFNPADLNGDVRIIKLDSNGNIYVGGDFTQARQSNGNLLTVSYIAKWNGTNWSALGDGVNNIVTSIAISGSDIYVGGIFTTAGGNSANRIAKWDGSNWSALGIGVNDRVFSIAISGSDIYVGGDFTLAGGNSANRIAKWNGTNWSALGVGVNNGVNDRVFSIAISGSDIYVGGNFTSAGGNSINRIVRWDGSNWTALGVGVNNGTNGSVRSIAISGSDIYIGGGFSSAGGNSANNVARWDGSNWTALGVGVNNGVAGTVQSIAISGSDIYIGGFFNSAGGDPAIQYIARWDGSNWYAVGNGVDFAVESIAISGNYIYVGGAFTSAGGVINAQYIAKFGPSVICKQYPNAICTNTNGPTNGSEVPVNNQSNPYLPAFDTYYAMKNPSALNKYPVQDQNQKHFVKQCHSRFPNANNGVNAVFNPCDNVTRMDPDTKQFYTYPTTNPDTCDGCILEPPAPPAPSAGWPAFIVGEIESASYSVSEDGQRVYITGFFGGTINLYNGGIVDTITEAPVIQLVTLSTIYDAFVACYSIGGQLLWATTIETRNGNVTQGISVANDSSGVYVCGLYDGNIDFYNGVTNGVLDGTGSANASLDVSSSTITFSAQFIVKYNTSGQIEWVTKVDNVPKLYSNITPPGLTFGICTNGTYLYAVGYYGDNTTIYDSGNITNGSIAYQLTTTNGNLNYFLIQYNTNGQVQWVTQGDDVVTTNYLGFSLTCDTQSVYISSIFSQSLGYCQTVSASAGPYTNPSPIGTITSSDSSNAILAYNTAGTFLWASKMDNPGFFNISHSMSVDSNNLYVLIQFFDNLTVYTGSNSGPISPSVPLTNIGNIGYAIVKYRINDSTPSNNGTIIWVQQINGGSSSQDPIILPSSISTDGNSVYVTLPLDTNLELYTNASSLGPGPVTVTLNKVSLSGDLDSFIMKYDTSGNLIWTNIIAGISDDWTTGIFSDGSSIYLTGFSSGITNLYNADGQNQPSIVATSINPAPYTNTYAFTAKYDTNGQVITK